MNDVGVYDPENEDVELGKAKCYIDPKNRITKKRLHEIHDNVAYDEPVSDGKMQNNCSTQLLQSTFRR